VTITFNPDKRAATLADRGLDFQDAAIVFGGRTYTLEDRRFAYPERRYQTIGFLAGRGSPCHQHEKVQCPRTSKI
jgi:uncharacterized DUF497 family protein